MKESEIMGNTWIKGSEKDTRIERKNNSKKRRGKNRLKRRLNY